MAIEKVKIRKNPFDALKAEHMLAVACMFGVLGLLFRFHTHATTPVASVEPESATISANAHTVSDSSASGGGAVKFTNASAALKTAYPYAFAKQDGTLVKVNGVNVRDGGVFINVASDPNDNFAYPQTRWDAVKTEGFNTLRLALNWPDFETSPGVFRADAFQTLDTTIQRAKAAGLYVILDPIHIKGGGNLPSFATGTDNVDQLNSYAGPYISEMARRYRDEPAVIAIDLVNEPKITALDNTRIMTMYNNLINTARAQDPKKILIIEPENGNSSLASVNWSVITNKSNLVMTYHDYFAGGDDDGFSAAGWPTGNFVYDGTSGYPSSQPAQLAANVDAYLNWLSGPQLPLYIGEYGIGITATNSQLWADDVVAVMNARNLPRSYWEWHSCGPMAILDCSNNWASWTPDLLTW